VNKYKFELGQVVFTLGIKNLLEGSYKPGEISIDEEALIKLKAARIIARLLKRHVMGDWGDIDETDKKENELSLIHGFRILSCYTVNKKAVWVITEADRSKTTLLLPEEY
jgi:hypothetical protein